MIEMKTLRVTEDGPQFEIVDAIARKQIDTLLLGGVTGEISVTVNADMAQNDETSADYVRNRTHWTDDDGTVHPLPEKYLPADVVAAIKALTELPITTENGYTDISGLRQATGISLVKADSAITVSTTLEGDKTITSTITLDADGYPSQIVTDGTTCAVSWKGFSDE